MKTAQDLTYSTAREYRAVAPMFIVLGADNVHNKINIRANVIACGCPDPSRLIYNNILTKSN